MIDSADIPNESQVSRMSIRALVTIIFVSTVCAISVGSAVFDILHSTTPAVGESLQSMTLVAIGFYFGQKNSNPPN